LASASFLFSSAYFSSSVISSPSGYGGGGFFHKGTPNLCKTIGITSLIGTTPPFISNLNSGSLGCIEFDLGSGLLGICVCLK
jgi:hypothetical protein